MRIRWRILACLCLGGLLVWFLADAGAVRDSVAEALALCARSVVPSLFPFLVASSALLALGFGELAAPWLAGLMEPLFRVPLIVHVRPVLPQCHGPVHAVLGPGVADGVPREQVAVLRIHQIFHL